MKKPEPESDVQVVDRPWKELTPERFAELVEEGARLEKTFDEASRSMRTLTPEDWARRSR